MNESAGCARSDSVRDVSNLGTSFGSGIVCYYMIQLPKDLNQFEQGVNQAAKGRNVSKVTHSRVGRSSP
jgi:hypothetical protein